ncbi:MAG: hypothetical protein NXH75_17820, partial [Halobacteriovoraceae bacterium]|nr:hypothetical protein [Halobacteriovoraceae bacterium]
MKILAQIAIGLLATTTALAGYNGEIEFSQAEIRNHKYKAFQLSKVAERCLQNYKSEHESFYRNNCWRTRRGRKICISKFYGDRRYTMKRGTRRSDGKILEYLPDALRTMGINPSFANQMEQISCVGLALNCLEEGFKKTNQASQWS